MNEDSRHEIRPEPWEPTQAEATEEREINRLAAETLRTLAVNFKDQRKATACELGARALERQMEGR